MGGFARALCALGVLLAATGSVLANPTYDGSTNGPMSCAEIGTKFSDATGVSIRTDEGFKVLIEALGAGLALDAAGLDCLGDDAGERSAEQANAVTGLIFSELLDPILP